MRRIRFYQLPILLILILFFAIYLSIFYVEYIHLDVNSESENEQNLPQHYMKMNHEKSKSWNKIIQEDNIMIEQIDYFIKSTTFSNWNTKNAGIKGRQIIENLLNPFLNTLIRFINNMENSNQINLKKSPRTSSSQTSLSNEDPIDQSVSILEADTFHVKKNPTEIKLFEHLNITLSKMQSLVNSFSSKLEEKNSSQYQISLNKTEDTMDRFRKMCYIQNSEVKKES